MTFCKIITLLKWWEEVKAKVSWNNWWPNRKTFQGIKQMRSYWNYPWQLLIFNRINLVIIFGKLNMKEITCPIVRMINVAQSTRDLKLSVLSMHYLLSLWMWSQQPNYVFDFASSRDRYHQIPAHWTQFCQKDCSIQPQFISLSLNKWPNVQSKCVKSKKKKSYNLRKRSAMLAQNSVTISS